MTRSDREQRLYDIWDDSLSAQERELVDRARAFCQEVLVPFAQMAHRDRLPMSKAVVRAWAATGLQGMQTPTEFGGQGASYFTKIRVVHELSRHSFAAAFSLNNSHSMVTMLATQTAPGIRNAYLPALLKGEMVASVALTEPQGGSDLGATRTSAKRADGGWILDGEKSWITNATISDLAVVTAQTGKGTRGIGRFLVDLNAAGVERTGAHAVEVGHAVGAGGLKFTQVWVPEHHLLEAPGEGFKRTMESINGARIHVAAMAVAALERALQQAVDYCSERFAFGKALIEQQGLRWQLADVANQLEAANLLVYRGAQMVHQKLPAALAAAHAKKFATHVAVPGIEACMQAMGATAMLASTGLARQLAEIKMAGYADGTTEVQNERIGGLLKGCYGT
ncbi:acyl-CoA dehydrogenase family protein [Variovorax sp. LjRoot178]|uniref:acyl-CoA dehydrogenase family protein n=1 Tax=Variovorax sp. LjRoot178 TaxID=3342277 RepID=UPI003ECF995E